MLKEGLKKEIMFFTRSFRMWGILVAAVIFAVASPLLMKLSYYMFTVIEDTDFGVTMAAALGNIADSGNMTLLTVDINSFLGMDTFTDPEIMAAMGVISSLGDLTSTLMLVTMIVLMYSAGGELKKRSMIIPQNAGLSPKLYILPKFIIYPVSMLAFGFCGMWVSYGVCALAFGEHCHLESSGVLIAALCVGIFDMFMTAVYFTMGLCTAKAGLSIVILYGGNVILTTLFSALGADKFHPFTLTSQAQDALLSGKVDNLNLWGSFAITLLIIVLCYFVTLFVISAKSVDNRGKEEMEL